MTRAHIKVLKEAFLPELERVKSYKTLLEARDWPTLEDVDVLRELFVIHHQTIPRRYIGGLYSAGGIYVLAFLTKEMEEQVGVKSAKFFRDYVINLKMNSVSHSELEDLERFRMGITYEKIKNILEEKFRDSDKYNNIFLRRLTLEDNPYTRYLFYRSFWHEIAPQGEYTKVEEFYKYTFLHRAGSNIYGPFLIPEDHFFKK